MLNRWCLSQSRLLQHLKYVCTTKYSTQSTSVEKIIRSRLRNFSKEKTDKFLQRNSFILDLHAEDLKRTFQRLNKLGFSPAHVFSHPKILLNTELQLINNYQRLQEVGFEEITVYRLVNFAKIMQASVHFNECYNFLPKTGNIIENAFQVANIPMRTEDETQYSNKMKLETVHRMAIRNYLIHHINCSSKEVDTMWYYYPSQRTLSLQNISCTVQILEDMFNTSIDRLPRHLLVHHAEDLVELRNEGSICGIDIRELMLLLPRCNVTRLKELRNVCYLYNLSDYAIAFSPRLFQMNVDTLSERLKNIAKLSRSQEFFRHAAIGRLITSMGQLTNYLESEQMHFWDTFNDTFVDYFLNRPSTKSRNQSIIFYLSTVLNKSKDEIKTALNTHPHSKTVPFRVIHDNIDYLLSVGFSQDEIFTDLYIALYSIDEIKQALMRLTDADETRTMKIDANKLTNSQRLRLCVYLIEKKCKFNNDGLFLEAYAPNFNPEDICRMNEIIKKSRMPSNSF